MFLWTLPTQILIICQCLAITVPRRAGPPRSNKSVNPPPEIPEERVEGAILIRSMITRRLGGETEEEAIIDPLFLSPYSIHPAIYKKTEGVKKRQSSLRLLTTQILPNL